MPYVRSIIKGETKPARSSYAIWLVNQSVLVFSYLAAGATTTLGLYIALLINSMIIFVLALRYGVGGFKPLDLVCMGLAALAIVLWVATNNPALAVYAFLASSTIGYIPTMRKSYLFPNSENKLSWGMYVVAALCNIIAINKFEAVIFLPPLFSFTMSLIIFVLLHRKAAVKLDLKHT